jgi:hypothetical protein
VDLEVSGPVVYGIDALEEGLGERLAVEEPGEGGGGVEVRYDHWRADGLPVTEGHSQHPSAVSDDAGHFGVATELATVALEQSEEMLGHGADAPLDLGHGGLPRGGQREGEAERAPRRVGATVGGVDGQKGEHAADLGVLAVIGEELVDDVHHAPEQGGAYGQALLLVGGRGPHLVE